MNSLSFSLPDLVNPEPFEWPLNSVFTNRYGKIQCWPRNYEYFQEFTNSLIPVFPSMILFIYVQSTLNIYWFIGIRIRCQQIQTNSYLVTFDYSQNLVQHSMNDPEGKKTTIRHYWEIGHVNKPFNGMFTLAFFLAKISAIMLCNYTPLLGNMTLSRMSSLCALFSNKLECLFESNNSLV